MKKLLFLLLPVTLLLPSCKKDEKASFQVSCTYLEVQEGTKFTYKQEANGSATTATSEVTSQETIDGVLLATIEGNSGQVSYITCEGDKIIQSAPAQTQTQGGASQTTSPLLMTLDLGAPIGEIMDVATVTSTYTGGGLTYDFTYDYKGSVVETGLSMEIEGMTYNNVIKYELITYYSAPDFGFEETAIVLVKYYIAPEVATIYAEFIEPNLGTTLSTISLVSYEY